MSLAPQIRSAADTLLARLTDELRQHVDHAVEEIATAADATTAEHARDAEAAFEARQQQALDALRAEHAAALEAAQRAADEAMAAARAEHTATQESLEAARAEMAAIRAEADGALAQAEAAVAQAMVEATAHADQSRAAALTDAAALVRDETQHRLSSLARAIAAMDDADSLSNVLDALAAGLETQASRTAVLVFRGEAARVWRRSGFGDAPEVPELALSEHDDLRAIVESARPTLLEGRGDAHPLLGVATLPHGATGLAVPVAIGGQVAALVYADPGDVSEPVVASEPAASEPVATSEPGDAETPSLPDVASPVWAEVVEVLARHAARCLEALTAMRASGYARPQRPDVVVPMPPHLRIVERPALETSVGDAIAQAQRVARLLVSEIRLSREDDIRQGRAAGDLEARLGGDIERARQQYLARVSEAVPGRDALFEDEVIRTLASGDASLLRRPTGS